MGKRKRSQAFPSSPASNSWPEVSSPINLAVLGLPDPIDVENPLQLQAIREASSSWSSRLGSKFSRPSIAAVNPCSATRSDHKKPKLGVPSANKAPAEAITMVDRKWDELPFDCLVEIFARVGLASLVEAVSIVCKSWYKTSLSPLCWQSLIFPKVIPLTRQERCYVDSLTMDEPLWDSYEEFVKFVIGRSNGTAIVVALLSNKYMTQEILDFISVRCPSLKGLSLPSCDFIFYHGIKFSSAIGKWRDLETLVVRRGFLLEEIILEISIHCKNFVSLTAVGVRISQSDASAIANLLPNIKYFSLRHSWIDRSKLLTIIKSCKELVKLDVCFCTGFDVDVEILNLAAHVATVNFEGSKLTYYDEYDDYTINNSDIDYCDNSD